MTQRPRSFAFATKAIAAASLFAAALQTPATAATFTWDAGAATDIWTSNGNWSQTGAPGTNDDLIFDLTGNPSTSAVTNIVSASIAVDSLRYSTHSSSGQLHHTQINNGATLTIDGANGNGDALLVGLLIPATTAGVTEARFSGTGRLSLASPLSNMVVGTAVASPNSFSAPAHLNLSGLSTFDATVNLVRIGDDRLADGKVSLATTSTITANAIHIAREQAAVDAGGTRGELQLGATTTLNTDLLSMAESRGGAVANLSFRAGVLNGALTLRGTIGGSSRADWFVGVSGNSALANAGTATATVDLSAGSLDARLDDWLIGSTPAGAPAGVSAAVTIHAGSVDVNQLIAGDSATNVTGTPLQHAEGSLSLVGTTLTAGSMVLGRSSSNSPTQQAIGTLTQQQGSIVSGPVVLGEQLGSAAAQGRLNLFGGTFTLTPGSNISRGSTGVSSPGSEGAIQLDGGALNMNGGSLSVDTLSLSSGVLSNLSSLTKPDGSPLPAEKTGAGKTVVLAGVNTYSSPTNILAGTWQVDGSHTGGAYTVQSSSILSGAGSLTVPMLTLGAGASLSPGGSGIDSLDISGTVHFEGTLLADLAGAGIGGADLLAVHGPITLAGESILDLNFMGLLDDPFYILLTYEVLNGTFATVADPIPEGYQLDYAFQGNSIAIVSVPEPSAGALTLLAAAWFGCRRRRTS